MTQTDEQTHVEEIAKIAAVSLGYEDHGIFTLMLHLDYGHSGQGAGGYTLDTPVHKDGKFKGRRGTAYGMEWIIRTMRAVGVKDWSELKGKTILAIRESDQLHARVIGIKPLPTEQGEVFMFDDLKPQDDE